MIKGSAVRKAEHQIEPLLNRSIVAARDVGRRNFAGELMQLFEPRWAPSSFNAQQWRALYARRGTEHWHTFFGLLVDTKKACAKKAAVLVVFSTNRRYNLQQAGAQFARDLDFRAAIPIRASSILPFMSHLPELSVCASNIPCHLALQCFRLRSELSGKLRSARSERR